MNSRNDKWLRPKRRPPRLTFAPLAWLKLQFFCHLGNTEIGGFGITAKDDLLYVEDFVTVRQRTSMVTVSMDDQAVADFADRCVDAGLPPQRFLRVWCHTHPGSSPLPSGTDEDTFSRVFGSCDWAVMFIVSRTCETYARLSFHVGPRSAVQLSVTIDWSAWPAALADPKNPLANVLIQWQQEFAANIQRIPEGMPMLSPSPVAPSAIGQIRFTQKHRRVLLPGRLMDLAPVIAWIAFAIKRIVAFAEEAGIGTGPADRLAPTHVVGEVDVVRHVASAVAQIFANRAHARRISAAGGGCRRIQQRLLVAGVTGEGVVAAGAVMD